MKTIKKYKCEEYFVGEKIIVNYYIECKKCGAKQSIKKHLRENNKRLVWFLDTTGWIMIGETGEFLCARCSGQQWKIDRIFFGN